MRKLLEQMSNKKGSAEVYSNLAKQMKQIEEQVIDKFQGRWVKEFLYFMEQTTKEFKTLKEQKNVLLTQNHNLYLQKIQLMTSLGSVKQEIDFMREERERKQLLKDKRVNAQKLQKRDSITEDEFFHILDSVKNDHFVPSRKKAALILLYVTGLRISNLLLLKIHHINDLFDKGSTTIPLIKRGSNKHLLSLSQKGKQIIEKYHSSFLCLMADKNRDGFLFTLKVNLEKAIDRTSFDHEINNILIKASQVFHKHIRTHSFRASIITDFLKRTPIDVVKQVMGHKDIKTTFQYKRGSISEIQL